jgi:hypothetical protein
MRNGHHHNQQKRMRGRNRNNNNRGHHNPLTRVYESNGPDVKIRGTAHHIAEKYIQLARDAQSSGDPISSEGYLQHAEHYFRLIAAAQAQFAQQNPNQPQQVYQRPDMDGDGDEEGGEAGDPNAQPYAGGQPVQPVQQQRPQQQQNQPQPSYNNQPQQNSGGGLPAFITGGQQQQPMNGHDGNEQGGNRNDRHNRFGRNRNRHFRHGGNENRGNYQGDNNQQAAAPASEQPQSETPPTAPGGNTPSE